MEKETRKDKVLMKKYAGILMLMLGSLLILSACSEKETAVTLPVGKTGESITISAGESIPDNFPKNIPIPKEAKVQTVLSSKDNITVSFDVKKSFNEILQLYKGHFKSSGYTEVQETLIEDSYTGSGILNGNELLVMISTPDPDATSVVLTYQFKKKLNSPHVIPIFPLGTKGKSLVIQP